MGPSSSSVRPPGLRGPLWFPCPSLSSSFHMYTLCGAQAHLGWTYRLAPVALLSSRKQIQLLLLVSAGCLRGITNSASPRLTARPPLPSPSQPVASQGA